MTLAPTPGTDLPSQKRLGPGPYSHPCENKAFSAHVGKHNAPETWGRAPAREGHAPGAGRGVQQASLGAGQRHTLEDPGSFPPSGPSRRQPPGTQLRPHRPAAPTDLVKLLLQGPALRDNGDLGLQVPVNRPVPKIRRANQRETGQAAPCQVQPEACREKETCRQEVSTAATTASPRRADMGEKQALGVPGQGDGLPWRTDSPWAHSRPRPLTWGRSSPAGSREQGRGDGLPGARLAQPRLPWEAKAH